MGAPDRRRRLGVRALVCAAFVGLATPAIAGTTVPGATTVLPSTPRAATGVFEAAHPDAPTLPGRIGAPRKVLQMITVTSSRWSSTSGTLKAWQRAPGGRWEVMHGPLPIVLGYHGWVIAAKRLQNTGTTPAGRFRMPMAFGLAADPGAALPYRSVDGNDWWPYEPRDPATYNIYQSHKDPHSKWRADFAEHLSSYPGQYDYAVVVGFNLPSGVHYSPRRHQLVARHPADTRRGGGIFLHVRGSGLTEGCVAMDRVHLPWLLRWLDPDRHPQLVMGPYAYVLTL